MYYKLTFNHDLIDESIDNGTYPIYAEVSNLKEMVERLLIGQL